MSMNTTMTVAPERPDTREPLLPPPGHTAPDGFPRIDPLDPQPDGPGDPFPPHRPQPEPDPLPDRPPMPEPEPQPFPQI